MQQIKFSAAFLFLFSLISFQTTFGQTDTNKFSDFAQQIPRANSEILAFNNLGEHVETILNNKALRRVLTQDDLGVFDMDETLENFHAVKPYFPDTIALSSNDELYTAVVDLSQVILRASLAIQSRLEENVDQIELKLLAQEITQDVSDFKIPDVTAWLTWSDEELAKTLFEDFKQQASIVELVTKLKYKSDATTFRVSGSVADITDAETLDVYLDLLSLDDPEEKLLTAVLGIEIFFEAELVDNGMRVSLGSDPADKPRTTAADLRGIQNGANQIAYSQWNVVRMKKAAEKFENMMGRWSKTKIGKDFIDSDIEDLWGSFSSMTQQLKALPDNGQLRSWTENNQIHANVRETGSPEAKTLVGSSVLNRIPADCESYALTNTQNLGEYLFSMLEGVEERASRQSLKSELKGESDKTEMIDAMIAGYYEHFGPMRTMIRDDLAKIPAKPFAILVDTQGTLDSLSIDSDSFDAPMLFKSDQFTRVALVSKVDDTALLQTKLMAVYRKLVDGFFALNDETAPADNNIFGNIDLGSGVKGKEFLFDWVDLIESAKIKIEGDLRPHVFVKDDFVVFSTSVAFSQTIINSKKPLKLKDVAPNESLVDTGHVRGMTIGNTVGTMFQFLGDGMSQQMGQVPGMATRINDMTEMAQGLCGIMNYCDWNSTQTGDVQNSRFIMDFKDK